MARHKRRRRRAPANPVADAANSAPDARAEPVASMSRKREWLLRLCASLLVPLVLSAAELALRLAGYGYSTGLFRELRIGRENFLVDNQQFTLRFFPPELARFPEPFRMAAQKTPGACRIFILGESAAMGDPEEAYGAGRYLQVLLHERFPGQSFEIINLGMAAISSHVILPIARECARQQGDIWIVYMGNNEFVGPFGAAGVFGPSRPPPLRLIRLGTALQQTRLGQAVVDLQGRVRKRATQPVAWGGMEMFAQTRVPPTDPVRATIQQHFERNLEDIVQAGLDSGAKVILNTVAVNLRDCHPFASATNAALRAGERAMLDTLCRAGMEAREKSDLAAAARGFEQAAAIDPQCAEVRFRWAQCLAAAGRAAEARRQFQAACDLDALPFRADSAVNGAIRRLGEKRAPGLALLDAASILATNHPAGVCGEETFYEHVHFHFDGNYRLGRAWAEQVAQLMPPAFTNRAGSEWASQSICEQRLGLTDWNRYFAWQYIMRRFGQSPLKDQPNAAARMQAAQATVRNLRSNMTSQAITPARDLYRDAIQRSPADHYLRKSHARFLEAIHEPDAARAEWERVQELIPHHFLPHFETGRLLAREGQWSAAKKPLTRAVELNPRMADAWFELGRCHAAEDAFELSLSELNRASALAPNQPAFLVFRGRVLAKLNRHSEAMNAYRAAIQSSPEYWDAHRALADEYLLSGMLPEAKSEYETALRLKPELVSAHLNLGITLAKLGQRNQAARHFSEALRLEPDNLEAREGLRRLQRSTGERP